MKKSLKVEFEGTDGAGKTTALKYFIEQLQARGQKVLETREVGNPHIPICVKLRETVLAPESNLSGQAMELIFSAMRIENDIFYKKVEDQYDFIVSDRGWFSHLSYTDHNVNKEFTEKLYLDLMQEITALPDIVIYFAVDSETALKRRVKRAGVVDVIEMKGTEFQEKVRDSFEDYLGSVENRSLVFHVDANDTIEGVRTQIDQIVSVLLNLPSSVEANG